MPLGASGRLGVSGVSGSFWELLGGSLWELRETLGVWKTQGASESFREPAHRESD